MTHRQPDLFGTTGTAAPLDPAPGRACAACGRRNNTRRPVCLRCYMNGTDAPRLPIGNEHQADERPTINADTLTRITLARADRITYDPETGTASYCQPTNQGA